MSIKSNKLTRCVFAASLVGIVLSVSLCVGSSFAWFQDTLSNKNTIEIGSFGVNAVAAQMNARSAGAKLSPTAVVLPAGFYQLSVRGVGNTPGYAVIFLDATMSDFRNDVYYTEQLIGGTTYTYWLMLLEETAVRITTVWAEMERDNPLEDDDYISYGRPPVVVKPEEEKTQKEQISGADSAPTTGDSDSAPSTGGEDSAPSTGDLDSAPTTSDSDSTPSTGGEDSAPSTGGEDSAPSTGGEDSAPTTSDSDSAPTTSDSDSAPTTSDSDSAPTTGDSDSAPTTSDSNSTSSTGGTDNAPATGSGESTPITGSTDSTSTSGADPQ